MIWWLEDRQRARLEKAAFAELLEKHDWLRSFRFKYLEGLQLYVEVEIVHDGENFPLAVLYPSTFPDTPPIVLPKSERRLSNHQYGAGGELCLEWRPDNWDPAVTGAMMIGSAYGLIAGERPVDDRPAIVPSAHQSSLGAELRFESWRLIVPDDAWASVEGGLSEMMAEISLLQTARTQSRVMHLTSIGNKEREFWKSSHPAPSNAMKRSGYLLKTAQDMSELVNHPPGEFGDLADRVPELAALLAIPDWTFLIVVEGSGRRSAFDILRDNGRPFLVPYRIVDDAALTRRSASNREVVARSWVAIVGCGSIGSKIAASLARAGVRKFLLVDEDVFFTGNIVRNELDARAVGWHKVDALADRIEQIVHNADILTRRVALGSQTSAAAMESVLEMIGECDLIIEATADPTAFNLCAGAARRAQKPMVWAEVFAGGIGGIVARVRPDVDPTPVSARNQIDNWCHDQRVVWAGRTARSYETEGEDGTPFIADDADVSVIAAHATRFAIDILQGGEPAFPYSAYVIGLTKAWIFQAPFDTCPIALQPEGPWDVELPANEKEDVAAFIDEIIEGESA
ncbi:ThiF family adenylyltransferase [Rhizobium bangladeshense]|uniref:ThiF family adenylyltransferase n=1 Tax=Rhizobium bangladeshense TaxID=1138189 RepID=UPI001A9925AA|nr:ThiF family adenylyltransferase [Rhizobium bangladeshense]QSY96046.1 ThiF family adenylyltransferase [Rhizobium bangladeshense]